MTNKLSIFGATGFVGGCYAEMYKDEIEKVDRNSTIAKTKDILYFISTVHNYNVFTNPFLDIDTNLTHLMRVLENFKNTYSKGSTFNFISSWFVYGEVDKFPVDESVPCNPKGFYSITKRTAEQLIISYCETFKLNYRILRLCNVYGLGDAKSSIKRNALQYLINEIVNNRDINLYNGGTDTRDFLYVKDVCRAIECCIKSSHVNEIINIGSGIPRQFVEIMNHTKEKTNSTSQFISVEPPEFHKLVQTDHMVLDTTKLKNLGYVEEYNFWDNINLIIDDCILRKEQG